VAAYPRLAARPGTPSYRGTLVAGSVVSVVLVSLLFIHPLGELVVFTVGPAAASWAFSSGSRAQYRCNAIVAAFASGTTGAAWLVATAGATENPPAVLIGALVSFLLLLGLAAVGAALLNRWLVRRGALAR
jgi:hypothetical protein